MSESLNKYQALLIVSFGGPDRPEDVMPFLRNVLRGKNVPDSRMLEVAKHYYSLGGVSPINGQNRHLIRALKEEFNQHDVALPIYFGNRNWHPLLQETLQQMKNDGVQSALAFFTSIFSCYSGCRQYRENIFEAQNAIGEGAPDVHKLRMSFNHPLLIDAMTDRVLDAMGKISRERQPLARVVFTAHSIPESMAVGCDYESQLAETCRLVADRSGIAEWKLAYQSRSGPPNQPWLEPDICDYLDELHASDTSDVIIMPIGFLSDHMEVLFDLDVEAKEKCDELKINMVRAKTVGTHPKFIAMIRELILERQFDTEREAIGDLPASHDVCPANCCLSGRPSKSCVT